MRKYYQIISQSISTNEAHIYGNDLRWKPAKYGGAKLFNSAQEAWQYTNDNNLTNATHVVPMFTGNII